jgi:hypothetical protein
MTDTPETPKPRRAKKDKPVEERIEELAEDAVAAGKKALESETGQKVAAAAESAFEKAEDLGRQAMESDVGRQAQATAKKVWSTELGRNVAVGAGAGAVLGVVLPIVGPIIGGLAGAGLGYLRTITRKG